METDAMPPEDLVRLTRRYAAPRPALALCDAPAGWDVASDERGPPTLALGRAHELCGPARMVLAAMIAGRVGGGSGAAWGGPVLWIRAAHAEGRLNPDGLARFFDPARLVLARPEREADVLWLAEETLRSGAAPLVIAEVAAPPPLTPVRRLHLAAEAGGVGAAAAHAPAPMALLLCPGRGGAQGVETRWSLAPAPGGGGAARQDEGGSGGTIRLAWTLELLRARLAPPRRWRIGWGAAGVEVRRLGDMGGHMGGASEDGASPEAGGAAHRVGGGGDAARGGPPAALRAGAPGGMAGLFGAT
jgi:protein ImuA